MCLQARRSLAVERCPLTRCCSARISPDWMEEVKLVGMWRDVERQADGVVAEQRGGAMSERVNSRT
jgi:hypothetical protein